MHNKLLKFKLISLWSLLVFIPLFSRTLVQIDETRYVSVAWEMWIHGNWLIPYLNGEVYHHKPPLLFWLINLTWAIFGVNDWSPRLISGCFSLGSLWLLMYLARKLWPQDLQIAQWAPFILIGCLLWSLFSTVVMFDIMLAFFALLSMVAIINRSWTLLGIAIGLGVLTKGPVILLHVLPVALLAPWWQATVSSWGKWYLGVFWSVILGATIALAWAIPAAIYGGDEFREAIFWGQTANRIVNSFAHQHPIWWYLPLLPIILFPWLFWKPVWQGLLKLPQHITDNGVRFCLIWFVVAFVVFSLISGKQPHYLLPIVPAFALLIAYLINKNDRIIILSTISILISIILPLSFIKATEPSYDIRTISRKINELQMNDQTIAHLGKYHGQYQFLGRLQQPLEVVTEYNMCSWLIKNPQAKLVIYLGKEHSNLKQYTDYIQKYRSKKVGIIDASFLYSGCLMPII